MKIALFMSSLFDYSALYCKKEVLIIKKNSTQYRMWLKHRGIKIERKRTRKKAALKAKKRNKINHNLKLKKELLYNPATRDFIFKAPCIFSLLNNMDETCGFFRKIISFISDRRNYGKSLFIDLSDITNLTIDSLIYLLAIINNLTTHLRHNFSFSGNVPTCESARKLFNESGFRSFVKFREKEQLNRSTNNLQIVSGNNCDTEIAKRMCDFVGEKAKIAGTCSPFLYIMMIEFMSNTQKHAYNGNYLLNPMWYCFAEYREQDNIIAFTFMDTGEGIPTTVRKNFAERIDFLRIKGEDKYVISALDGEFRTSTKQTYRGKGLPKIREFCSEQKIQKMRIITNKADVIVNSDGYKSQVIDYPLLGTLFYWQVNLSKLKGE